MIIIPLRQPPASSIPRPCRWLIAATLLLSLAAQAEPVICHLSYGGANQDLEASPVTSPYSVAAQAIGSYFLFRIVFQKEPADLASIKVYVFADTNAGPTPIHQATHPYPPPRNPGAYGFTGLNRVYEPVRDGELQYWCELARASGLTP